MIKDLYVKAEKAISDGFINLFAKKYDKNEDFAKIIASQVPKNKPSQNYGNSGFFNYRLMSGFYYPQLIESTIESQEKILIKNMSTIKEDSNQEFEIEFSSLEDLKEKLKLRDLYDEL